MQVQSCKSSGMEVSPETYNACTFEIIDKWDPTKHAKTCDTMFYLRDGTGAYVWDCDKWIFLDFTGYTAPDWKAKEGEAGFIKNKPFETLGNGLTVDENGVLSVCVDDNYNLLPNSTWNLGKGDWSWPVSGSYEIVEPEADKPDSHILHSLPSTVTTQQARQLPNPIPVTAGDIITIAFDFKDLNWTKSSNLLVMRVLPERDTTPSQNNSVQNVSWNSNTFGITEETPTFIRLVRSFTVIASGFLNVIPYNSDRTGNYEQWYREIMVIKGKECEMPDRWYPYFTDIPIPEQVQSDWNEKDEDSKAFIKNKPTIPEGTVLYPTTGDKTNGAMTQKAVTDELDKKLTQEKSDTLYVSLTEPNHVLGETTFDILHFSSDTPKTPLEFNAAWTANSHYVKMTNGVLSIHIDGARPKVDGMTGQSYYTVATLPSGFRDIVNDHDIQFVWSSMNGGVLRYSGKVQKSTGDIIFYLAPNTDKLMTTHRFSIYIPYIPV